MYIYICEYGEHAKNCFEWFGILFRVWPDVFYVSRYVSMLICDLHSSIVQVVNCVMRSWLCGSSLYVWLPVGLSFYLRFLQDKLQEQFACVRHATLLYNAHLVYTNLPLDDMRPFFFLVFLSLQTSIQAPGWVSHVFYWQGALQLFGGFQWSGVQPEVEQAAFWSNGACLQLPGCCSEWVDKSGDIAWECIDMWKIRFQNCTPCENTPNPKAYWCLQYSQLPYETTGRLGGQIQAHPNSKRKSEDIRGISCISPWKTLGTQTRKKRRVSGKTRGFGRNPRFSKPVLK